MKYTALFFSLISFCYQSNAAFDHSHKAFSKMLSQYVKMSADKTSSKVDYKNFNKKDLEIYLKSISAVSKKEFGTFTKNEQLAFFINAYNAFTIKIILDNYPLKSIKDIGSWYKNTWEIKFFKLFGEDTSLDKIEHEYTRGNNSLNKDPRIHFAFNCASIGCPALLNTAWVSTKLEQQFDQAATGFLKDHSRNRVNTSKKTIELNNIFKWYGKDFDKKGAKYGSLRGFLKTYADALSKNEKERTLILSDKTPISYTGYDWKLNKQ